MGAIFSYKCATCSKVHEVSPSFAFTEPWQYTTLSEEQRLNDAKLGADICIIHASGHFDFFIRVCLEIPIKGVDQPFLWGVWISVSESSFRRYGDTWDNPVETDEYFGWLCSKVSLYPDTLNLKRSRIRDQMGRGRPSRWSRPTIPSRSIAERV